MFVIITEMSGTPSLTPEQQSSSMAYMLGAPGFLGIIPGNPSYLLFETEADATTFVPYNGLQEAVSLITSTTIVPLEESGKMADDFFNMKTTFPRNTIPSPGSGIPSA